MVDLYGAVNYTEGSSASNYGFTNEYQSQGLVYLRARMYAPAMGRFLTRDTWDGDANRPVSYNRWAYVEGNPVNLTDPTGQFPCEICDLITIAWPSCRAYCDCGATWPWPPWPGQYIEPWKTYKDYDPVSNSIPANKWGGLDSNPWDIERSALVREWLGKAKGMEWKYNDAKELAKWLISQEIGIALRQTLGDNVWRDGNGEKAFEKVLGNMKGLFSNGISSEDLADFTAFFNPDGFKPFSQTDWNELMKAPPMSPYGNTVDAYWGTVVPIYTVVQFWTPKEAQGSRNKDITVTSPLTGADLFYVDY